MDQEALARLMTTRAGWLLPDGSIAVADAIMEHLPALKATTYGGHVLAYERELAEIDEYVALSMSDLGPDDHPEWHRFDGMKDEPRERLTARLYGLGLIRLGLHVDKDLFRGVGAAARTTAWLADPANCILEAEGLAEHVDARERSIARMARTLGSRPVLHRYVLVAQDRRGRPVEPRLEKVVEDDPTPGPSRR